MVILLATLYHLLGIYMVCMVTLVREYALLECYSFASVTY